jgi:3-hydroxybutyrate dehydrogenase
MSDAGLKGRAAIVTGGASGLGRAVALRLAREGADVCIMSLSRQKVEMVDGEVKYFASVSEIEETQNAIGALGVRCIGIDGDISVAADVERMVFSTVEAFGRLDILVNNAATNVVHPILNHDDDAWKRVIDVNLFGPYLCVRVALPHLIKNGWGRIVSIGSTNAHVGAAEYSAYAASKHGLLGFNKSLALEAAAHNITANTISPGMIETPSAKLHIAKWAEAKGISYEAMREEFVADYPQKRFVQPEEIADLVVYLCREKAKAVNGEDIKITTGAMY